MIFKVTNKKENRSYTDEAPAFIIENNVFYAVDFSKVLPSEAVLFQINLDENITIDIQ